MRNPRKNLPTAARRFFYRLVILYVLGALAIGVICNSNAEGLVSGEGNANASPWVIAIKNAGISSLDSVINAGILTSAWSSGNSFLFMSSRSLYSLAVAGNAPKIFTHCNRYGLPIYAVSAAALFMPLAYLSCDDQAGEVFNWFISLTNTAGFTSWIVCCIVMLRFRKACVTQSVQVPYRSRFQPWAAPICIGFFTFLLLMNGFTVFYQGNFTASGFLTSYLGIPLFLTLYFGHKLIAGRKDSWLIPPADVDLTTGVEEMEADAQMWEAMERAAMEKKGNALQNSKVWNKISAIWG